MYYLGRVRYSKSFKWGKIYRRVQKWQGAWLRYFLFEEWKDSVIRFMEHGCFY